MTKREQQERERTAKIQARRQEAQDARSAYVNAWNNLNRLGDEYQQLYHSAFEHSCTWDTIDHNDSEARVDWHNRNEEYDTRLHNALEAYAMAKGGLSESRKFYERKRKVAERDEAREAARIARAAEREAQKQQEPKAVALREKKTAQYKKGMDFIRERLANADDWYL